MKAWTLHREGLSYREVADIFGVSRQRIEQRILRARRRKEHVLNLELAIHLGIGSNEAHQLRDFFGQTDLWAPVGAKIHRKTLRKTTKEITVNYLKLGTRITCDCGYKVEGNAVIAIRHNNATHAGRFKIRETVKP